MFRLIVCFSSCLLACAGQFDSMGLQTVGGPPGRAAATTNHAAVGSWFGKAVQVCTDPGAPDCFKVTLFMTPSLFADGTFLGYDSLDLAGPPFGPHGTAHGKWVPVNRTEIVADYVLIQSPFPAPASPAVGANRFRWNAAVVDDDTMVGYVNVYPFPPIPLDWENLTRVDQFPAFPKEALGIVTAPQGFVKDPKQCQVPGCPLVFRFRIKRIAIPSSAGPPPGPF